MRGRSAYYLRLLLQIGLVLKYFEEAIMCDIVFMIQYKQFLLKTSRKVTPWRPFPRGYKDDLYVARQDVREDGRRTDLDSHDDGMVSTSDARHTC